MGACSGVRMDNDQGIEVVTNGSGTWDSGSDELTLTKGSFGTIQDEKLYKVTDSGNGASSPPKAQYKCLESSGSKKRFRKY